MDHDDATIGRILTRREAMALTAKFGAIGALLAASRSALGAPPTTQPRPPLVASPAMTEGPFFNDEKLHRADLRGNTTRAAVVDAVPLALAIAVYRLDGDAFAPMPGVQVDVWHCDAIGVYSGEDHPMNSERTGGQNWLRGYQTTDPSGVATFTTIVPGWYPGRAPHVHFKVRPEVVEGQPAKEFTSQLFFNAKELEPIYAAGVYGKRGMHDMTNERDGIYTARLSDGTSAGDQMLLDLEANEEGKPGYWTQLPILLTDTSLRSGRGMRGPGGRRPPG